MRERLHKIKIKLKANIKYKTKIIYNSDTS